MLLDQRDKKSNSLINILNNQFKPTLIQNTIKFYLIEDLNEQKKQKKTKNKLN